MKNTICGLAFWLVAFTGLGDWNASAASAENGKVAFTKNGCWQCHGFVGQGSIATSGGKVLAGTALSLDAFDSFVRNSNGPMPPYRAAILSDSDLADIYAYLQSIPKLDASSIPLLQ
jgi:mono/diheme cytochrome c family protein